MKTVCGILLVMAVLWPFSCTPQSGITVGSGDCDTVYIESPEIEAMNNGMKACKEMVEKLTAENMELTDQNESITANLASAMTTIKSQQATIKNQETVISDLTADNTRLEGLLQECLDKPADTVELIVEVMPKPVIDTVIVTHCADSTKNTTWFHHGGIDTPYPKDISFATKEFAFTRVTFNTPLTDSIKVQKSYKLKRKKDFENARTTFEFIE